MARKSWQEYRHNQDLGVDTELVYIAHVINTRPSGRGALCGMHGPSLQQRQWPARGQRGSAGATAANECLELITQPCPCQSLTQHPGVPHRHPLPGNEGRARGPPATILITVLSRRKQSGTAEPQSLGGEGTGLIL